FVKFVINSARDGSSAAVCSSSNKIFGSVNVAINNDSAWRSPPDKKTTFADKRSSKTKFNVSKYSLNKSRRFFVTPGFKLRRLFREYAIAKFSSIVIDGAVPAIGSWNTRPI